MLAKKKAPAQKPKSAPKKVAKKPAAGGTKAPAKKPVPKKAPPPKAAPVQAQKKPPASAASDRGRAGKATAGKEGPKVSSIRIRLSAFDHVVLDEAGTKIIDAAERSGAIVHGPIPLPTKIRKFTVNKSTFVHKNARDQYEMRTHSRLIDLTETTFKTMESLQNLSLPSGVDIEIKMG